MDATATWRQLMNAMTKDALFKIISACARRAAYKYGAAFTYKDVVKEMVHYDHGRVACVKAAPRMLCDACELAGFPVWTSAPDCAMHPY